MLHKTESKVTLSTPVRYLKGVGPKKAFLLSQLGIQSVRDILEYYPRDWIFAPPPTNVGHLKPGRQATIVALIESTDYQPYRRTPIFEAMVADDTGICRIIWFHGSYLQNQLEPGMTITATGKVSIYKHQIQLTNPKFTVVKQESLDPTAYFSGGIYPASGKVSSNWIKKLIRGLVSQLDCLIEEFYAADFRRQRELVTRKEAFASIHNPENNSQLNMAKRRLKYDELFVMQLGLAVKRYHARHNAAAPALSCSEQIDRRIRRRFPFLLTPDQEKVIAEITSDMKKTTPMNRLLQGDVGSGKTVVALYAALVAVANKQQAAIMAPTEVLANQHFISIERYLRKSNVKRLLITGGLSGQKRKSALKKIKQGDIDIVVGTVALLQRDVEFKSLALSIIDEQHKFGVHQRAGLRKATTPHCLVMTATPIPRTLAMTVFGDLDTSVIRHCPPGRPHIITSHVQKEDRPKAYDFIRKKLKAGNQAYFVYPRIYATDQNDRQKAAIEQFHKLSKEILPEFKVALLHGRMPFLKKQKIMAEFGKGKIDVLVSTVVIEVGIDVPNATIMVIDGAGRFGLAQLHQLRGRIGRGQVKSYCLLFAETKNEVSMERLEVMTRTRDGFEIAEYDLQLRGPGELFSVRQHGLPDLKIADILDDYELLTMARRDAFGIIETDPALTAPHHKNIRRELITRFGHAIKLADIA